MIIGLKWFVGEKSLGGMVKVGMNTNSPGNIGSIPHQIFLLNQNLGMMQACSAVFNYP